MGVAQTKVGTVTVTTGSQIVQGSGTNWGALSTPCVFKVDIDGESTYSVGSIASSDKIVLAANYLGSTNSGIDYMVVSDFSTNRGYARVHQGDADWADILSEQVIDKIDTDIQNIITGNATPTIQESLVASPSANATPVGNASISGKSSGFLRLYLRGNASPVAVPYWKLWK